MNKRVVSAMSVSALVLGALGCTSESNWRALEQYRPMVDAPKSAGSSWVDAESSFSFEKDLSVKVEVMLSEPFDANGRGTVRMLHAVADYSVNQLRVTKSVYNGALDAHGGKALDLGSSGVNVGLAKFMAAQILGEADSHPYVRDLTGSCDVTVRPKAGKTWGDVTGSEDLEIAASMAE
jgi:hypothetical protein